jgi:hypothetical protein
MSTNFSGEHPGLDYTQLPSNKNLCEKGSVPVNVYGKQRNSLVGARNAAQ